MRDGAFYPEKKIGYGGADVFSRCHCKQVVSKEGGGVKKGKKRCRFIIELTLTWNWAITHENSLSVWYLHKNNSECTSSVQTKNLSCVIALLLT